MHQLTKLFKKADKIITTMIRIPVRLKVLRMNQILLIMQTLIITTQILSDIKIIHAAKKTVFKIRIHLIVIMMIAMTSFQNTI